MMEAEKDLGEATGYRVRMAESAGDALGVLLPSTNPWGPSDCGRQDCVPCGQDDARRLDCRRRNILYENVCQVCNQKDGKDGNDDQKDGKGIYVGESSRSLHERAKEHVADRDNLKEDSHMVKHWVCDHPDLLEPPKFKFRIVRSFQDPLTRQLAEAVRIERSGENILNSKSEFNRCRIPRLKINLEEWGVWRKEKEKAEEERKDEDLEKEAEESLEFRTPNKRKPDEIPKGRKAKKLRFEKLVGWGEGPSIQENQTEPEAEGRVEDTLESHISPGEGSRSDWKSSQGGSSNRADDSRGAREVKTLPDGWKIGQNRGENLPEGWRPTDQVDKSLPDGWKTGVLAPSVNTQAAPLRNIIEYVPNDASEPDGWKAVKNRTLEPAEGPRERVSSVNTPTTSKRNIVTDVPEDKAVPGGWMESPTTTGDPAKGKRRVRGKLSVKEIQEMKKSCHNIEGMFLKQKLPTIKVTAEDVQHNTSLGPSATLVSSKECTGVQSVHSPGKPLCTRAGLSNITIRSTSDMRKADTHAHQISHPWESSEAFAGIGLVADGVGPKKPKTSEHHPPRPVVEPLPGVVMGVGGEDPILTPGGRPMFREEEISTIGSMIKKWEEMEKEGGETKEGKG